MQSCMPLLREAAPPPPGVIEQWLAQRASAATGRCPPYADALHPTRHFRLLYCDGVGLRGGSGVAAAGGASSQGELDPCAENLVAVTARGSGKRMRTDTSAPPSIGLPPSPSLQAPVTILGGPASVVPPPFPALVNWVLRSLASGAIGVSRQPAVGTGDAAPCTASLRSWQAECIEVTLVPWTASSVAAASLLPRPVPVVSRVITHLRLDTCGSRWCARIGRQHRSNNVAWHVSLARQVAWQTCYDPECRALRFASAPTTLPPELVPDQVPPGYTIRAPGGGGGGDQGAVGSEQAAPLTDAPPASARTGTNDEEAVLDAEIAAFLDAYEAT